MPVRGRLPTVAILAALALVACSRPTATDRRWAKTLSADPILHTPIPGTALGPVHVYVGHGSGPETTWSEASRAGSVVGSPSALMQEAIQRAQAAGWRTGAPFCSKDGSFLVYGTKQFPGFVGSLTLEVVNPPERVLRFLVKASTPPAAGGGQVTLAPAQRLPSSPAPSCLSED
jgi:hypothetical protein